MSKFNEAVNLTEYCKSFESIDKLIDSQEGYESYVKLCSLLCFGSIVKEYKIICEKNSYFEFLAKVLCTSASYSLDFDFKIARFEKNFKAIKDASLNERKIHIFLYTSQIINYMISSIKLRNIIVELNGLKILLNLLNEKTFIQELINFGSDSVSLIVFNINWLSKLADENKHIWEELNASQILTNYIKSYEFAQLNALMALSNIANDKDLENISEFDMAIKILADFAIQCAFKSNLNSQEEFKYGDNVYKFEMKSIFDSKNDCKLSISGLLASLYRISINAKRKLEIFQYPKFKDALFELIYNGNDAEKQLSLELLIQLCYDKSVFEEIKNNNKLNEFIRKLSKSENVTYKKVLKTCDQFLWLFEKDKKTISLNESHIMISYNSASRELCLKIKEFLESKNFKVWIDVDEIHGSSLNAMAKAVEDAKIVLMCVTEKYRQSTNCQAEAQYAFRLNKKIIPCIMEKGYSSVTGWLGFIIGDKIFIDFMKYPLNDSFKRVLDQISRFEKQIQHNLQQSEIKTLKPEQKSETVNIKKPTELPNQKNFVSWNENETEKWFTDNSLSNVFNILKPINGKYLLQLYQLQIHTPEFFYKSLTSYNSVNIKDVIKFGVIIKELFE